MIQSSNKFMIDRKFGLELEFGSSDKVSCQDIADFLKKHTEFDVKTTGWSETEKNNRYWHLKTDSSCNPNSHLRRDVGLELASYVGETLEELDHICDVASKLKRENYRTNRNCGFHIHVDVSDLSKTEIANIVGWWLKCEPWVYRAVPMYRSTSRYCKPLRKFYKGALTNDINPYCFFNNFIPASNSPHNNEARKLALNLVNCMANSRSSYRARTLELRLPEGTLDGFVIKQWVLLFYSFINKTLKFSYPTDLNIYRTLKPVLKCFDLDIKSIKTDEQLQNRIFLLNKMLFYTKLREHKRSYFQVEKAILDTDKHMPTFKTNFKKNEKTKRKSKKVSV